MNLPAVDILQSAMDQPKNLFGQHLHAKKLPSFLPRELEFQSMKLPSSALHLMDRKDQSLLQPMAIAALDHYFCRFVTESLGESREVQARAP